MGPILRSGNPSATADGSDNAGRFLYEVALNHSTRCTVGVIDEVEMPGGTTVVFGNQGGPKPAELHRSNLDAADEAGKRIAQRNYWLDVAAHCISIWSKIKPLLFLRNQITCDSSRLLLGP